MRPVVASLDEARSPLSYALRYAARGWKVLPLLPGTKLPHGRLAPNGHNDATSDEAKIRQWWKLEPAANIGLNMIASGMVAIDIDPRNGGDLTIQEVERQHGEVPDTVMALTPSGGEHRLFACSAGVRLPGKLGAGVDVKHDGYIVVEPSVYAENGGKWLWEASSDPLDGAALPPLPTWLTSWEREQSDEIARTATAVLMSVADVAELRSALSVIDADERDAWLEVGMALHATRAGQQAYGVWCDWSRQSEKFDAADQQRVWRSFRRGGLSGVSKATIFARAQALGWVNPRLVEAQRQREIYEQAQAAHAAAKPIIIGKSSIEIRPFPVEALNEGYRWIAATSAHAHPLLTQGALLTMASAATARRYCSASGMPCHLYIGLMAHAATAARYALRSVARAMHEAGLRSSVRENRITSPQQLNALIYRSPSALYLSDDYGDQLKFGRRQSSGLIEQVLNRISQWLRDGSDVLLDWAEVTGKAPPGSAAQCMIYAPAMTMLAIIAGSQVGSALRRSEMARGGVDSIIFLPAVGETDWVDMGVARELAPPDALIAALRAAKGYAPGVTEETAAQTMGSSAGVAPSLIPVRFAGDLDAAKRSLTRRYERANADMRTLMRGARINIERIAVALAAIADPVAPVATQEIIDWSAHFVGQSLSATGALYKVLAAEDGERPDAYHSIREAIAAAGANGATRRELVQNSRAFRALDEASRDEMIKKLINDEMVVEVKAGRTMRIVSAIYVESQESISNEGEV